MANNRLEVSWISQSVTVSKCFLCPSIKKPLLCNQVKKIKFKTSTIFGYFICRSFRNCMWFFKLLYESMGYLSIHLNDPDSLYLMSGFCGMLLLTKEPKVLCFSVDKNIAQSIHCVIWYTINKASLKIFKFTHFWHLWRIALGKV